MNASRTGRSVESSRGYVIHEWSGDDIAAGTVLPFTTAPINGWSRTHHATLEAARAHIATLPALVKVRVTFEAYVPVPASEQQVHDWLRFALHENGSLDGSNPLADEALEAFNVDVDDYSEVR